MRLNKVFFVLFALVMVASRNATALTMATAAFARIDTTTQGNWKGVYGAGGEAISGDSTNYPSYAQVNFMYASSYVWTSSTTDVRALEKSAAPGRIASCWYPTPGGPGTTNFYSPTMAIDVNLTDGKTHQVALYALDWDTTERAEAVQVLDASSEAVLDSETISGFHGGQYLVWNLTGHVTLNVSQLGGGNAVVSGLFFDPPGVNLSISKTHTGNFTIAENGAAYSVTVSNVPGSATTNGEVTVTEAVPFGLTLISMSGTGWTCPGGTTCTRTDALAGGGSYPPITVAVNVAGDAPSSVTNQVSVSGGGTASAHASDPTTITGGAGFVRIDTTTQGNWKGVYGADGEAINSNSTNYPSYAQVTIKYANSYVWTSSTTDVRALKKSAASGRIASCWYAVAGDQDPINAQFPTMVIDVNLTDGKAHQVALYALDWDTTERVEAVQVWDASTSNVVLDARTISGFHGGQYLVWNLSGHVTLNVSQLAGGNGVVSGLFFDPPGVNLNISKTHSSDFTLAENGATYSVAVSNVAGSATTNGEVKVTETIPTGLTLISMSGTGWTCPGSTTCTRTDTLAGGESYPPITVTVNVAADAPASVTNQVSVSGGGSPAANASDPTTITAGAVFITTDTTTQGNWKGVYGADGEAISGDSTNYPGYAQVTIKYANSYVWTSSTTDVRALEKHAASGRIASCWYPAPGSPPVISSLPATPGFAIDVNLTDGKTHQVALYALDWDTTERAEEVQVQDASTNAVLDTRTISDFHGGQYLVWNLTGHVTLNVSQLTAGSNAVVSGLFFEP